MVGVQNGIWVMGLYRLASEEFDDKAQTDNWNIILEISSQHLYVRATSLGADMAFWLASG